MTRTVLADADGLDAVADALAHGHAVAIPTDTVYGLAVDASVDGAIDRLFALKDRPRSMPIAVLVADVEQAWALTDPPVPAAAAALAARHWPGALTIVVRRAPYWRADIGDDGGTVGLRCPGHRWVRALCQRCGPIATTSANAHGEPTLTTAAAVSEALGIGVAIVVDGGTCDGAPSTVVDCHSGPEPRVLRRGALGDEMLVVRTDTD